MERMDSAAIELVEPASALRVGPAAIARWRHLSRPEE